LPTRDELTTAWADAILPKLARRITVWFGNGRFVSVDDGVATYALPDINFKSRAEKYLTDVQTALREHFGVAVPLNLVVDEHGDTPPPPDAVTDDEPDFDPAAVDMDAATSPEDHLKKAFPGAEEVTAEDE
jgi:hypothetical protein